jgi:hypothetical protein
LAKPEFLCQLHLSQSAGSIEAFEFPLSVPAVILVLGIAVIGRRRLIEALASLLTTQGGAASDATSYILLDVSELLKMTGWRALTFLIVAGTAESQRRVIALSAPAHWTKSSPCTRRKRLEPAL